MKESDTCVYIALLFPGPENKQAVGATNEAFGLILCYVIPAKIAKCRLSYDSNRKGAFEPLDPQPSKLP